MYEGKMFISPTFGGQEVHIGKYLSADIYYVHVLIKIILIDIDNTLVYIGRGYFFPLCVVVISVIVAYVKCKIKEKLYDYAQQS